MTVLEAWTKLCESGEVTPDLEEEQLAYPDGSKMVRSRRCRLLSMGGTYELAVLEQNFSVGVLYVASVGKVRIDNVDDMQRIIDPWNALTSRLDQQRQKSCDMEAARILSKHP